MSTISEITDFYIEDIIFWVNRQLARAGKGYINPRSIETEYKKGNIRVWEDDNNNLVAIAIMSKSKMLWNLVVSEKFRSKGIGSQLLKLIDPDMVRVKAKPIGHLSKEQLSNFVDPTPFYEKNGFIIVNWDKARNISNRGKDDEMHYHKESKEDSILIMRNEKQQSLEENKW